MRTAVLARSLSLLFRRVNYLPLSLAQTGRKMLLNDKQILLFDGGGGHRKKYFFIIHRSLCCQLLVGLREVSSVH